MYWLDVGAWVGSACLLVAYGSRSRTSRTKHEVLNVAGSCLLGAHATARAMPAQACVNVAWAAIGLRRLCRREPPV